MAGVEFQTRRGGVPDSLDLDSKEKESLRLSEVQFGRGEGKAVGGLGFK